MARSVSLFHYIKQAVYAAIFIWFVVLAMDLVEGKVSLVWAVGASAVASSTYIVFTRPSCDASRSLHLVGAYAISITVGIACSHMLVFVSQHTGLPYVRVVELVTAVSVGVALFLQTILGFSHPPAAGLALILTSEYWHYDTIIIILIAICVLALISQLLRKHIKDLNPDA